MAGVIACISAAAAPEITLQQIKTGFKGKFCYVHARAGMTPDGKAIITTQPLLLKGTDVFTVWKCSKAMTAARHGATLKNQKL